MTLPPLPSQEPSRAARATSSARSRRWLAVLVSPEAVALVLLLGAFIAGTFLSRDFLDGRYLLDSTSLYMEPALMALAMTFVIVSGNIDLSVASTLALTGVVCAELYTRCHVPMGLAVMLAPLIGGLLGLVNGLLITRLRLPSLTVTLGTLALYRGLAQVMVGDKPVSGFPDWFTGIDQRHVGGWVPMPLLVFLILATVCGLILHKTTFGRCLYALGTNEPAARFSGIRTGATKLGVFTMAGAFAGLAAMIMVSRLGAVQYNIADGQELAVITAVVLGGTDIFGGRGTIFGTVVAVFLLGIIRCAMGVANIRPEYQLAVNGSLLIFAVVLCRLLTRFGANRRT
jgi:rhamnose transport system permease protein